MRWQDFRRSDNVEEAGDSGGGRFLGGGLRLSGGGIILVIVVSLLLGKNPLDVLALLTSGDAGSPPSVSAPAREPLPNDENHQFVSAVLGDIEDTWGKVFAQQNAQYQPPKLVLFHGRVNSACGLASAAMGPFYCPNDERVYLDLSFFDELHRRFGAPGDFARAYVIAHEVGHHVQHLLGIEQQARQQMERSSEAGRNALSVRQELQADCFAGVWGYYAKQRPGVLDTSDIEGGLRAAAAIGDDRLQKQSQGVVVPESFTHGSSAQRVKWFRTGLQTGDPRQCNTFSTRDL